MSAPAPLWETSSVDVAWIVTPLGPAAFFLYAFIAEPWLWTPPPSEAQAAMWLGLTGVLACVVGLYREHRTLSADGTTMTYDRRWLWCPRWRRRVVHRVTPATYEVYDDSETVWHTVRVRDEVGREHALLMANTEEEARAFLAGLTRAQEPVEA